MVFKPPLCHRRAPWSPEGHVLGSIEVIGTYHLCSASLWVILYRFNCFRSFYRTYYFDTNIIPKDINTMIKPNGLRIASIWWVYRRPSYSRYSHRIEIFFHLTFRYFHFIYWELYSSNVKRSPWELMHEASISKLSLSESTREINSLILAE